jgi:hypothetical protein
MSDGEYGSLSTGGADLGTFGQVGSGGIPGLDMVSDLASLGGTALALRALKNKAAKKPPGKDFNDQPVADTVGSQSGQSVLDQRI